NPEDPNVPNEDVPEEDPHHLLDYDEEEDTEMDIEEEEPEEEPFVGGLAPWALRRNLEALRGQDRIREAESETSRTEVALLGSEAKIGKME
nr:hypothetical protein [Tanacetum cinerariifolium]